MFWSKRSGESEDYQGVIIPGMSMEISGQEICLGGCVWEDVSGENIHGNVQITMQHYKYLSAAVMICVSLVNTHKDRQCLILVVLLAQPAALKKYTTW